VRRATFNTSEIEDYRVDGGMLISMLERVVSLLPDDVVDLHLRTRLRTRTQDGHVETLGDGTTDLVNGVVPKPDAIDLDLHGRIPSEDPHGTFLFSLRLDRRGDGQIYAAGPEDLAKEVFETMRRTMAAAASGPEPEAPESLTMRIRRRICTSWTYYALMAAALTCMMTGFALSMRGYGDAVLIAGWTIMLLAFIVLASMPRKTYPTWQERLDRREAMRTIDLSLPEAAPPAIGHLKLLPAPHIRI
jgi:hypothetical protein